MQFISQADLSQFLVENYMTFLILGGLLVIMYAYRDVRLPATKNFQLIIAVLFMMSMAFSLERWAVFSPDRINVRIVTSVVHYVLQPLVVYLELIILMPDHYRDSKPKQMLLALPLIINSVIYLAAPFAGKLVFYYDEHYWFCRGPLGVSIYIVTFFYLALLVRWSLWFIRHDDKRLGIILMFIAGIAVLTGILEGLNLVPGYIDEAFALGTLLYYIYLITLHESQLQAKLAKKELELSENKLRLMREQIRPHFIFNALQMIKSLIRSDQDKAVRRLEDFSDYLHANLDVISSDRLISFDEELEHIGAYVSLALADESKGIYVDYDIEERFFNLPPLTIEPLVENAIRHGVYNGGNVLVSTKSEDGNFIVTVSDDGRGFDRCAAENEYDHTGIGIANIKTRLEMLCGGILEINSNDSGTTAVVRIPASGRVADTE